MGCLLLLVTFFVPRVFMVLIFLFTHWFSQAFQTVIWPLLGFFIMPYTTLAYMLAMIYGNHQLSGGWIVLMIFAVIIDLGGYGGSYKRYR